MLTIFINYLSKEQKILIFKLIFFLIIIYSLPVFAEEIIYGKPKVIDGDTIHIGKNKIRLFGIDAPEKDQICIKDNINSSILNLDAANQFANLRIDDSSFDCRLDNLKEVNYPFK